MTEEEAKTKWCPFARVHQRTSFDVGAWETNSNRWADDEAAHPDDMQGTQLGSNCIGSACMAWRWSHGFPLPDDPPEISSRYHGLCGLAGKP